MRIVLLITLVLFLFSCSSSPSDKGGDSSYTQYPPISTDQNTSQEINTTVVFRVSVPQITPQDEFVCLKFDDDKSPYKMSLDGADTWQIEINASNADATHYKYCRNCECGGADEYLGLNGVGWRENPNGDDYLKDSPYEDSVSRWRWLDENLTSIDINTSSYLSKKPDMNKTGYVSGVALNDWWRHEWIDSMDKTLQKASRNLEAKWVQIIPVPQILNINNPNTLQINSDGINGMSDADLNATIDMAHDQGFQVFLNPSPWSFEVDNSDSNHSQGWWDSYFNALKPVYIHYAEIAQAKGVEMFEVRAWINIDGVTTQEAQKMEDNASALLAEVKDIYSGKIAVQSICYDTDRPILQMQRDADYLTINIWQFYPWPFAKTDDTNVSVMKNKLQNDLLSCHSYYEDKNISKPIIVEQLAMASFNGAIDHNDIEGIDSFHEDNTSYFFDLQEQADSFEAIFQTMADASWIDGDFIFTYFYWDSIGKDINVRGKKPVEDEIKKWHNWLNQ